MILALDQSLTSTGYVVGKKGKICSHGVIVTKAEKKKRNIGSMDDACRRTRLIISDIVDQIKYFDVKAIACEEYAGFSQSKASADALATSRTIVCAVSHMMNIPMFFIPINDVKLALTRNKKASKNEMIESAYSRFPEVFESYKSERSANGWEGKTEHVADAIGVYLCARQLPSIKMMENLIN